jgi:hypothetical protein
MLLIAPAALWLLLAIPLVWVAHAVARTSFNRRQRIVQAAVRSLLLAALVLAVARPVLLTSSSRESVVYLVDVSHSVATPGVEAAAQAIDEMNRTVQPAHARIVAFAKTSVVVEDTASLLRLVQAEGSASGASGPDRGGTDLEAALLAARGELAPAQPSCASPPAGLPCPPSRSPAARLPTRGSTPWTCRGVSRRGGRSAPRCESAAIGTGRRRCACDPAPPCSRHGR